MGERYKRIGLFATPDSMESLQEQMTNADMNIAMGLTWNFMVTEFNKVLDSMEDAKCQTIKSLE